MGKSDESARPRQAGNASLRRGSWSDQLSASSRSPSPAGRRRRRCGIPPKLYRIGEVAGYSGVSRQTIHNYTTMGLLQECKWTDGGHRLYDDSVFGRLDEIFELRARRVSLEGIRQRLARMD